MITISLCMIVKNEEKVLARCLDSVAPLMDEIIIVDTGSTDHTKEIAARYTKNIFDFTWCDDFSAARNFSFSKATMEYIYAPDADEYIDPANREQFAQLKELLLPEIEIVQMHYLTESLHNTVLNAHNELRPKLFRRLRSFTWIDPIHETVRLDPVVFDSDIEIRHLPQGEHQKRDFSIFQKSYMRDGRLSERIVKMYAIELLKRGTRQDFADAQPLFEKLYRENVTDMYSCILAACYRRQDFADKFFSVALKSIATGGCSEICYEIGSYYMEREDFEEAYLWFYNAAFETEPILDIETQGRLAPEALSQCCLQQADKLEADSADAQSLLGQARKYMQQAQNWSLPDE